MLVWHLSPADLACGVVFDVTHSLSYLHTRPQAVLAALRVRIFWTYPAGAK